MARPRSAGYDGQRADILAAAARLFATQGYSATTMAQVAQACGVSKATLYHYVRDKHGLLEQVTHTHVQVLEALVQDVRQRWPLHQPAPLLAPQQARQHLLALIHAFMQAYAQARHEHQVLTSDVRFLADGPRRQVLHGQRRVVAAFADAITRARPELAGQQLATPLAMLLFGMMNWTFTWLRLDGPLAHAQVAQLVCDVMLGGLDAVDPGRLERQEKRASAAGA